MSLEPNPSSSSSSSSIGERERERDMEEQSHRHVATLVSSLLSQALLLLFLLSPSSSSPFSLPNLFPSSSSFPLPPNLIAALLFNFLNSSAAMVSPSRKRKLLTDDEPSVVVPRANLDHYRLCLRMSAPTFEWLASLLDPLLDCDDPAGVVALGLTGPTRLALALTRLASGTPYADLARRFAVPERVARFCVKRLCRVLCTNFRFWLAFPSQPELRTVSSGFLPIGLPDCCGAIACGRFELGGGDGSVVAAQLVVDSSFKILNFAVGFRGERTEADVLRCSSLFKDANAGQLLGPTKYFVGGGLYPLLPWLMTPFPDPASGSCEEDFNALHRAMRGPALRVLSSLRHWGVLNSLMEEEDVKMAVACIGTCAILHNGLLMREDYSALVDATEDLSTVSERAREDVGSEISITDRKGFLLRSTLAVTAKATRSSTRVEPC